MNPLSENEIKQAEIGIILCPEANGNLFPEEAMGALIEYGFTHLKFDKVNAFYANNNLATKRFIKKLNFIYEPVFLPPPIRHFGGNSYKLKPNY